MNARQTLLLSPSPGALPTASGHNPCTVHSRVVLRCVRSPAGGGYNGGQSEVITGRLLRTLFGSREEYVLATKVHGRTMPGPNGRGLSRKHVLASIDASLERLGVDYVDLYQMIPQCIDQGVAILPWSPLARGLLAGNRTREGERLTVRSRTDEFGDNLYTPEVDFAVVDRVAEVASERGVPQAQVALAWLLHKPGVTAPIVGATKPEHVDDAVAAERLSLSEEEIARLEEPYVPHAISGH